MTLDQYSFVTLKSLDALLLDLGVVERHLGVVFKQKRTMIICIFFRSNSKKINGPFEHQMSVEIQPEVRRYWTLYLALCSIPLQ